MLRREPLVLGSTDPGVEFVNYYGNTSPFALESPRDSLGKGLADVSLLSVGCRMSHLADYLSIFRSVHRSTMAQTRLPVSLKRFGDRFVQHRGDFFALPVLPIDCIISHATIHFFHDPRHGNHAEARGAIDKTYHAPTKLREIADGLILPTVVSIAVNREEGNFPNNAHLSHERWVASFADAGFAMREHFFDYLCGGIPPQPEYLQAEYRQSNVFRRAPIHVSGWWGTTFSTRRDAACEFLRHGMEHEHRTGVAALAAIGVRLRYGAFAR